MILLPKNSRRPMLGKTSFGTNGNSIFGLSFQLELAKKFWGGYSWRRDHAGRLAAVAGNGFILFSHRKYGLDK